VDSTQQDIFTRNMCTSITEFTLAANQPKILVKDLAEDVGASLILILMATFDDHAMFREFCALS